MPRNRIALDLSLLTAAKIAVIAVIYFSLFAAYDHRPDDTAAHLLGAIPLKQGQ